MLIFEYIIKSDTAMLISLWIIPIMLFLSYFISKKFDISKNRIVSFFIFIIFLIVCVHNIGVYRNNKAYSDFSLEIIWYDEYLNSKIEDKLKKDENDSLKEKCENMDFSYINLIGEKYVACSFFDVAENIIDNKYILGRDTSLLVDYYNDPIIIRTKTENAYTLSNLQNKIRNTKNLSEKMKLQNTYKSLKERYDSSIEKEKEEKKKWTMINDFYTKYDNINFILEKKKKKYFIINNFIK